MHIQNSFDWEDFLKFCEFLKNHNYLITDEPSINEAIKRSVISRAYYSAYHITRKYVNYVPKNGKDSHLGLIITLNNMAHNLDEKLYSNISDLLFDLKNSRQIADYKDDLLTFYEKVSPKSSINKARKIIDLLEELKEKNKG